MTKQINKKYIKQAKELLNMSDTELMARSMIDKDRGFKIKSWDSIKNKPYKIMLSKSLVERLGWPLTRDEDGIWWLEVNKEKNKK